MRRLLAVAAIALAAAPVDPAAASREIPLTRAGGVYQVTATINDWLTQAFTVDSGASDVQVSAEVFAALYPPGSPSPRFLPGASYRLADGRVVGSRRFLIPRLRIANYVFPDVDASIAAPHAPLLLGQNVLSRLGAWTIDNRRNVLVLAERGSGSSDRGCQHWRTAPSSCAVAALRDFFRDVRPPHDVTNLLLLDSDGDRATVLVDVVRLAGRQPEARLCGPMHLRREATGWRIAGEAGLREIRRDARCVP
jgi:hypothetical protein